MVSLPARSLRTAGALCLTALLLVSACRQPDAEVDEAATADTAAPQEPAGGLTIRGEFQTPEAVLHDPDADVYLVSNINGGPLERDGNGFIARVRPDGTVDQIRWVDGATEGVSLSAPKGMAIRGDSLFVADIDTVRIFHRRSGEALGAWGVEGSSFLNDIAVGPQGSIYVTDTGLRMGEGGFEPAGTDAIYRFDAAGRPERLAAGQELMAPNGIVADGQGVVVAPFGGRELVRVDASGSRSSIATLPAGQLDGLVRTRDGVFLVSSWEGGAVYRVRSGGEPSALVEDLEAPAAIGWDAERGRVLIPLFNGNEVLVREVSLEDRAGAGDTAAADTARDS